ncbi:hypothetical protein F0562_022174 [Nyssa sinensis]|uniref:Uncharacterized protein n=1 Tax=Nyssa sinensis TaxID=561372 RepID=A0A5J5BQ03_9ASTE|nr:hypothetical protein F0562_022174 [Nyssa sinensis]
MEKKESSRESNSCSVPAAVPGRFGGPDVAIVMKLGTALKLRSMGWGYGLEPLAEAAALGSDAAVVDKQKWLRQWLANQIDLDLGGPRFGFL